MVTDSFAYTGAEQTFSVPMGVIKADLKLWGGEGGDGGGTAPGGDGGYQELLGIGVSPGETLYVYVGGQGVDGKNGSDSAGGWPNGGTGEGGAFAGEIGGGGGGGRSDVRQGGNALTNIIAAAAGGGGGGGADEGEAGNGGNGGAAGGSSGGSGGNPVPGRGGSGGTQTAGGTGGGSTTDGTNGADGVQWGGGNGGTNHGAGGGDGYYGGGGGGGASQNQDVKVRGGGGGGGSSTALATADSTSTLSGAQIGNGEVSITYPDNAPQNLAVTDTTSDSISLAWDAPTGDLETIQNYRVYRSTAAGVTTADTLAGTPTGTTFTDTGLNSETTYYYRVSAVYPSGEGGLSNEVSGSTPLPEPTLDSVTATAENELTVAWTKNDSSTGGEFEVYRSTDGTLGTLVADALTPSTTSYVDTTVLDGEEYHYTVVRVDANGNSSYSNQLAEVTILPAPSGLTLGAVGADTVGLSWTDTSDNEDGFRIYQSRDDGATWTLAATTAPDTTTTTVTGLLNGEQYRFAMSAYTEHSESYYTPGLKSGPGGS